jgi:HSP20 family molecular chaperone IbpA
VFPAISVSEDAASVYVRAEFPGIKTDELKITMKNEGFPISGPPARQRRQAINAVDPMRYDAIP